MAVGANKINNLSISQKANNSQNIVSEVNSSLKSLSCHQNKVVQNPL